VKQNFYESYFDVDYFSVSVFLYAFEQDDYILGMLGNVRELQKGGILEISRYYHRNLIKFKEIFHIKTLHTA